MGLAPSIDNYLDAHKDIEHRVLVGKLAITLAIRRAERASNLWRDPRNVHNRINFATQPDNWMTELFRVLVAEQSKASFINRLQKCSFICFNYDRVIEQFFFFAIMSYFGLDSQETAKICSENLHVVHPYGTAGSYRYGDQFNDFGSDESDNEIIKAAESVRTFTEGVGDEHLVEAVHQSINSCEVLVFLGFAFHPLNIKSMRPKCLYNYSRVIGTCYGITEENLRILKSELSKDFFGAQEKIELQSMICADLIRFHAAYLSGRG